MSSDAIIANSLENGSKFVKIIFRNEYDLNTKEFENKLKKDNDFKESIYLTRIKKGPIMGGCILKNSQLDSRGNRNEGWGVQEKRGGVMYYPPLGWTGIGLNVSGKFDKGKDNWIGINNGVGEWCVAYILINNNDNYKRKLKEKYSINRENENKEGVYCIHKINIAEEFAETVEIDRKYYKIMFMVRINPDQIKNKENNNYWILNGNTSEIRPYRILFKNVIK